MFTNEFGFNSTITTVLDETSQWPDVTVVIDDEGVVIKQFHKDHNPADVIILTHKMYYDMIESMKHTEGAFITRYNN